MKTREKPGDRPHKDLERMRRRIAGLAARNRVQNRELEQMRADRDLYRLVADFTSDWEYWIDAEGIVRYVSPSCEAITGYAPEFFYKSLTFLEGIIHHDDRTAVAEYWHDTRRHDSSIHFRIVTRDGRERWIGQQCQKACDAEGKWCGKRYSNRDITEYKLKEEEEARNRAIIERFSQEMDIIAGIGRLINSTLDIDEVYERFVSEASKLIPCDRVSVNLKMPDTNIITVAYVVGIDLPGCGRGDVVPAAGTITDAIMQTRKGLFINSKDSEEIVTRFSGSLAAPVLMERMHSLMGVPLISRDVAIGSLILWRKAKKTFNDQDLRLLERIGEQIAGAVANAQLYARLRETKNSLRQTLDELDRRVHERTFELREVNTALRVLLKKRDTDHIQVGEQLQSNVRQLVMPFLNRLRGLQTDHQGLTYLEALETNLSNILSPFVNQLSVAYKNLTPTEIKIATLITQGKKSREIAVLLGCSIGTIITHRSNIRQKLKLRGNNANLRSHLLSI